MTMKSEHSEQPRDGTPSTVATNNTPAVLREAADAEHSGWVYYEHNGQDVPDDDLLDVASHVNEVDDADKNDNSWTFRGYKKLVKLVNDAKGAATKQVLAFIKKHMRGTKLIFVMGQSGTGKSTLLKELTGMNLKIGSTMSSGTLQYGVCPAIVDGEQYLFVDTAGFGAGDLDNMDNFHDIMSCLSTLGPFVTVAGILFVYGAPKERVMEDDLRTIRWIECFAGPEFFSNITIVTTNWDGYAKKRFDSTWSKLKELKQQEDIVHILDPPGRYHGGSMYHHGIPGGQECAFSFDSALDPEEDHAKRGEEVRNLVRRHYMNAKAPKLQIVRELDKGTQVLETQAAKVLNSHLQSTSIRIMDDQAVVVGKIQDAMIPAGSAARPPAVREPEVPTTKTEKTARPATSKEAKNSPSPETKSFPKANAADPKRPQPNEPESWVRKLLRWFVVAKESAEFFQEARRTGYESHNRKEAGGPPTPSWDILGALRAWWSG